MADKRLSLVVPLLVLSFSLSLLSSQGAQKSAASASVHDSKVGRSAEKSKSAKETEPDIDFAPYMTTLQKLIKSHWDPPKSGTTHRTVVTFRIHTDGAISDVAVKNASGDPKTDQAGVEAVLRTSPAPSLPAGAPKTVDIEFTLDYNVFSASLQARSTADSATANRLLAEAKTLTDGGMFTDALKKIKGAASAASTDNCAAQLEETGKAIATKLPPEEAARLLSDALFVDPDDYGLRQQLDAKLKDLGLDPTSAQTHLKLARDHRDASDIDGAIAEYKICIDLSHDPRVNDELIKASQKVAAGDLLERWNVALAQVDNAENHTGVGYAYEVAGDYANAARQYHLALDKDAAFDMAKQRLAALPVPGAAASRDFPIDDLKITKQQISVSGQSTPALSITPQKRAAILNNEGVTLMNQKKNLASIAKFQEAMKLVPGYRYAQDNLAMAYNNCALTLPPRQAVRYFHKALFIQNNLTTEQNLDALLLNTGTDPKSFAARVKLAAACQREKDYQGAFVEYRCALSMKQDAQIKEKLEECRKLAKP